ncbi:MAG: hypothetical protein P857_1121 [Candidatus Xenolissoclinum pacificiensis L6]|uniref:Uncharacterized protein n=1 Tax=Candidatus Xenolissoclinum pacificiensis L6 TaxID=1401685 RepID=W2V0J4_9RICK|nr:MAG: hypothetical protein P857_1121 [Candidatus Xenolissoclinum pacificiensis L6]
MLWSLLSQNSPIIPEDLLYHEVGTVSILNKVTTEVNIHDLYLDQILFLDNIQVKFLGCWALCDYGEKEYFALLNIMTVDSKLELFNGWLFSKYPSLNNFENVYYDILLLDCKLYT